MKQVLVGVRCVNDHAVFRPETFYAQISDALKARIKQLQASILAVKAYAVEEFDYSGTWSSLYIDPEEDEIDESRLSGYLDAIQEKSKCVEIPTLKVTDTEFCWTAVPKHGSDDMALQTTRIPIAFLDEGDDLYLDLHQ